jgi:capsular polysaccharide export protein
LVHRGRSLTLEELFAGIYLLGPRYLADLDDPVTGCLATIMTVVAERERNAMRMASKMLGRGKPGHVLAGPHWPAALRPVEFASLNKVFGKKFSNLLDIPATFRVCAELDYQIALGLLLAGRFAGTPAGDRVARQVLMSAGPEAANAMLTLFWAMRPSPSIAQIWAIHRERTGQLDAAREVFSLLSDQPSALAIKPQIEPISAKRYAATLALAQFELRQRRLGKARELFHTLLLSGHATGEVMEGLAEIAGLSFQFRAAAEILAIFNRLEPDWRDGRGWWLETRARLLADQPFEAMRALSLAVTASDTYIEAVGSSEDGLQGAFGPLPFAMAALAIAETRVTKGDALARARAMIAREQPERAELLLRDFQPKPHEVVRHVILLSQSMSYQGRLQDAKRLLVGMLRTHSTLLIYREGVRVAILANDYAWAKELLDAAKALDFDLGDMYSRKVLLGLGEIKESYLSFRRMKASVIISKYLGARYKQSAISVREKTVSKICILACFGPGDEIRFASFYRQMADLFSSKEVAFTCDPRLEGLLNRSFSGLKFIPSRRLRYLRWADDISRYSDLPTSECFSFFDNEGWKAANASDAVMFATDLLGDVVQGKASFTGSAYFKPLMERVAYWKRRLQNYSHSPIVGINWRSTVSTHTRNEHYLSIEDMDAIFSMGNVNFINLQYDECAEELAAIEKRYPGKIINFTELDQFNDLDGVAALMECLDLVVAPATTVVELAGALGRPTLLLSNSSELHWRKREDGTDSWHRSIKHVEGEILGDKHSLAAAAAKAIEAAIASRVDSKLSKSA